MLWQAHASWQLTLRDQVAVPFAGRATNLSDCEKPYRGGWRD